MHSMVYSRVFGQSRQQWKWVCLAVIPLLALSCGKSPKMRFTDSREALETCESFLHAIKSHDNVPMEELIHITRQWRELADSAWNCILNDTTNNRNHHAKTAFIIFCDSIRTELLRAAQSRERSYADYYHLISRLNPIDLSGEEIQTHIKYYSRFFESLDSGDTYHFTAKRAVAHYEQTLSNAMRKGFKSKEDVLTFVSEEDKEFRTFLCHLSMMSNIPVRNIKTLTEQAVRQIYSLADGDEPVFDKAEVVVLMTMRTNRRLILNARTCVADIKKGRAKQAKIENAYLLMLLQPWMTFDDVSFAFTTPEQRRDLTRLADTMPAMLSALKTADIKIKAAELPSILIQRYIDNILFTQ